MALPPAFLDDLRSRVSLAQVVGRKVSWDPRKTNAAKRDYWAPCPFHQEKSASFHVDDAKGFYHCFGCQAGGDAIRFVCETENLDFMAAVEVLAREAGMSLPDRDPVAAARAQAATGLVEALEAAVQVYRMSLNSGRGAEARAYLDRRGLSETTRARFEVGFAPDSRTGLLDQLSAKGFSRERLVEAGLVGVSDGGEAYDRFRGRVMFPIRDARGRAIAFGARALRGDQQPKYLNSPETPLFDKGRSLYNLGLARAAAGKAGTVIVVEGFMDVIALAQAGIAHAVAPLGTAITEAQLALLWRLAAEPVVALDGDKAGQGAAQRLIDLALPLLAPERSLRFVVLPAHKDPDDIVREGGARAMEAIIAGSRPILELIWTRETEGVVLDSPERRAALDARLRGHLARITDAGLRAHYQAEIRARRAALFAPVRRPRGGGPAPWRPKVAEGLAVPATKASPLAQADAGAAARVGESAILAGCLNHPALVPVFEDRLERMAFRCADLALVRDALLSALHGPLGEGAVSLAEAVAARLGRDPRNDLAAVGQVRANRHLDPGADPVRAALAIEEELGKHAATTGRLAEVRDAETELAGAADEGLTFRLRAAADAAHSAVTRPLADAGSDQDAEHAAFTAFIDAIVAQQAVIRPKRR